MNGRRTSPYPSTLRNLFIALVAGASFAGSRGTLSFLFFQLSDRALGVSPQQFRRKFPVSNDLSITQETAEETWRRIASKETSVSARSRLVLRSVPMKAEFETGAHGRSALTESERFALCETTAAPVEPSHSGARACSTSKSRRRRLLALFSLALPFGLGAGISVRAGRDRTSSGYLRGVPFSLATPWAEAAVEGGRETAGEVMEPIPEDVVRKVAKSLAQYSKELESAFDWYLYDFRDAVLRQDWAVVLSQFKGTSTQGGLNRVERDFMAPMKSVATTLPREMGGEKIEESIGRFLSAMKELKHIAEGARGPVNDEEEQQAKVAWNEGRRALNGFVEDVNGMVIVPYTQMQEGVSKKQKLLEASIAPLPYLPEDPKAYVRTKREYTESKKAKLRERNGGAGMGVAGIITAI
uniref:Transmembrane protein n=1 Tax=Chromera velia CCMP2878 TaxID=1169474 RepID=A0A0G4HS88_9ALVE|eukprot:Cvel_8197.t1-p1 / transcript=Cvel_8197.t1 / gene=Cvel_8197 / organism=Chromera_velia_CCMP2878 / gene_product=hypothetical protein / transcript_product=hypothetical protein / location=Cvel_scaffold447:4047-7138(+) / protein_length=411 / sequence_SO=supercontig / SO=protein_coding / is_pseudo=false